MTQTQRYASLTKVLTSVLALLGGWLSVSPLVLRSAENVLTQLSFGILVSFIALGYLLGLFRESRTKVPSMWYVLVLGLVLSSGAVLTYTTSTLFFRSTLLTAGLVVLLAALSICWGSRFLTGEGEATTIFG